MAERPDLVAMQLRHEIQLAIEHLADNGSVEGGGGMGSEDIYLSVDGVNFHIQIHWPKLPKAGE